MKLNIRAFALTSGLILGTTLFEFTWWVIAFDGITREPTLIGMLYRSYNISPLGSIVGLVWGFVDGAIFGGIVAWLYNLLAARLLSA